MIKISINKIIEFRRKSPNSRRTFLDNLKKIKPKAEKGSGGDHWTHSISVINNIFESGNSNLLKEKRNLLIDKHNATSYPVPKLMYKRNIDILTKFETFRFSRIKPNQKLNFLHKSRDKSYLSVKGLTIQVKPSQVFTFVESRTEKISAVWFVAKIDGYEIEELGIFVDALYLYLKSNYSKEFEIDPEYCTVVDAITLDVVNYAQLTSGRVPRLLNSTLDSMGKLINAKLPSTAY